MCWWRGIRESAGSDRSPQRQQGFLPDQTLTGAAGSTGLYISGRFFLSSGLSFFGGGGGTLGTTRGGTTGGATAFPGAGGGGGGARRGIGVGVTAGFTGGRG